LGVALNEGLLNKNRRVNLDNQLADCMEASELCRKFEILLQGIGIDGKQARVANFPLGNRWRIARIDQRFSGYQ